MKKLLVLVLALASLSAFAQYRSDEGRITTRDGRTTVRISIGDNRNGNVNQRIRLLEEAVRDLQDMVYDLQDSNRRPRIAYVCVMNTSFDGTFIGKGSTKLEAEAITRQNCEAGRARFCSSTRVTCESN